MRDEPFPEGPDLPIDRRVDRRGFVARLSAAIGAAVLGPRELAASPGAGPPVTGRGSDTPGAARGPAGSGGGPRRPAPPPHLRSRRPARLPRPSEISADLHELTVAEAAALVDAGEVAPSELLRAFLERIEALDATYRAFNAVPAERALERARALGATPRGGPLHGIPLAIKDNFYTAGVPTTANSRIYAGFVPEYDATAWARLRDEGAVLLGKTQMGPLATTRATTPEGDPTTVNAWAPHDPSVSPGGSSSGSATAVAARLAPGATGTQTGGSITGPSSAQGLTGLKPTMGRVSLRGIIPLTYTRDHVGPLARDARDAALLLQAMAGPDPLDPRTRGLPPVPDLGLAAEPVERGGGVALRWPTRIGVLPGWAAGPDASDDPEPGAPAAEERHRRRHARAERTAEARRAMLRTYEELGAELVEVEPPRDWERLTSRALNDVRLPERSEIFLEHLRTDVRSFGVSLAPWINGLLLPAAEYVRGQRARLSLLGRVLDDVFSRCDVVVQPEPFPFDMIGLPLVAFPIGFEDASVGVERPIGAMLGGQPYAEDRLLSLVAAWQAATDWHRRRPPEPAPPAGRPPERGRDARRLQPRDVMRRGE